MPAGTYDIVIEAGEPWTLPVLYETGQPLVGVDVVPGWTAEALFWDANGISVSITEVESALGGIALTDTGNITVSLTEAGVALITSSGEWILLLRDPQNNPRHLLRGLLTYRRTT
jgi:hypothetical protein